MLGQFIARDAFAAVSDGQMSDDLLRFASRDEQVVTLDFRLSTSHGSTAVMFRFGTWPTGMRITSFRDVTSTTDTEFEPALAT